MASAMRRMGEFLGLVEEADYDEEFDVEPEQARSQPAVRAVSSRPVAAVSTLEGRRSVEAGDSSVSRIDKVIPHTYNDARRIGESFRSGTPVIMNLEEITDDDAKRLVDFAAGLVFAGFGTMTRVTAKVFLLSPEGVEVSDEDQAAIVAGGFFNQN
ncbi:MAG TPA: cell division protein SepF [Aeromicrobium sp.]|nr:cell division protein SepF [Aeromicrobium sp.]